MYINLSLSLKVLQSERAEQVALPIPQLGIKSFAKPGTRRKKTEDKPSQNI
jgi:hypothetical protein